MLPTVSFRSTIGANITVNSTKKTEEQTIYKILNECNNDVARFRVYVNYIGTSCDNRKLRFKIQKLQEKIFKSLLAQRDFILIYTKSSNNSTTRDVVKLENVICFTLIELSYFEDLIEKLNYLIKRFPLSDSNELVINLGFEDSPTNEEQNTDEFNSPTQSNNDYILRSIILNTHNNNKEHNNLAGLIEYLENLKDEIEQFDVYQTRYNVAFDSDDFINIVNTYNEENKQISFYEENSCYRSLAWYRSCSRRKSMCILLLIFIIVIITIGIAVLIIHIFNK